MRFRNFKIVAYEMLTNAYEMLTRAYGRHVFFYFPYLYWKFSAYLITFVYAYFYSKVAAPC